MSSYQPTSPPANGGSNILSCDTFAATGAPVGGIGGAGVTYVPSVGDDYPANPTFSSITMGSPGTITTPGTVVLSTLVTSSISGLGSLVINAVGNINVSSINGINPFSQNYVVSTVTAAPGGYVSTPQLSVSSINGTSWLAIVSTVNGLAA